MEPSTSIEKFNEEEMVQSLKSQLEHALKRPEVYSMEDTREQLTTRLNDVTKTCGTRMGKRLSSGSRRLKGCMMSTSRRCASFMNN